MKHKFKIRNINSITVLKMIRIQNLDLIEYLFIVYPNLKDFKLFMLQYTKKNYKNVYFGNLFFHCLEKEQIKNFLIEI